MNSSKPKIYAGVIGLCMAIGIGYVAHHIRQVEKTTIVNNGELNTHSSSRASTTIIRTEEKRDIKRPQEKEILIITATTTVTKAPIISQSKIIEKTDSKQIKISDSDAQRIIAGHNEARSAVGVTAVQYSNELAVGAQEWANTLAGGCDIRHAPSSTRKGAGENIWYGSGYDVWNVSEMVTDWVNEKPLYNYDSNTCAPGKVCGHYTQVVWAKTSTVGCGIAACDADNARIFVCRYSPLGNIVGQKPY